MIKFKQQTTNPEHLPGVLFVFTLFYWVTTAISLTSTPSVSLDDFTVSAKVCYILGNEIDGVSQELLTMADLVVKIPMLGQKESLNVSVAAGVVLFQMSPHTT